MSDPVRTRWAWAVATFFGVGNLSPGSGTWASVATVLLWAAVARWLPALLAWPDALAIAVAITLIGTRASTIVARESGIKDPSFVVIDEVAGQLFALIGNPVSWKSLVLGLILFRAFDILKPPPIRQIERLPEGSGIMLDDVAAGLLALALMHGARWLHWIG